MIKLYSKMWNRYFVRLLEGEPFFYEPELRTKAQKAAGWPVLHSVVALAGSTMYKIFAGEAE